MDTSTATAIVSAFDVDTEGWAARGDVASFTRQANDGNPGGYVEWSDALLGQDSYWVAASQFLGDKSIFHGGSLSFDLESLPAANYDGIDDVVLTGGGIVLVFDAAQPGTTWTHYSITLDDAAGWKVGSLSGPAIKAQCWQLFAAEWG